MRGHRRLQFESPAVKARTGSVRGAWVRGDVMHVATSDREARRVGVLDVARICALERNGQRRGRLGHMGDRKIPLVTDALLLEKQRKGEGWG